MVEDENGRLVIRLGDTTDHGGTVITGAEIWTVEGKPVARIGDQVICPRCDNKVYEIIEGNERMVCFNRPIAFEGHRTSCGARLIPSLRRVSYSQVPVSSSSPNNNASILTGGSGGVTRSSLSSRNSTSQTNENLSHHRKFKLLNHNGQPLSDIPYKISSADSNKTIEGRTDSAGLTEDFQTVRSEHAIFSIVAAGREYEGARASTFLFHANHITEVRVKVYWLHENLWDDTWIDIYRRTADSIATLLQRNTYNTGRTVVYTCEDFALSVLVHFAHRNKLPLNLKTGAASFQNIDFDIDSRYEISDSDMQGFLRDVQTVYGAKDTHKNCIKVDDKTTLQVGDLFLRTSDSGHVQVVVSNNRQEIAIKQGNFPGMLEAGFYRISGGLTGYTLGGEHGSGSPTGAYYLGVEAQDGVYSFGDDNVWRYTSPVTRATDNGETWNNMNGYRWNFEQFNY